MDNERGANPTIQEIKPGFSWREIIASEGPGALLMGLGNGFALAELQKQDPKIALFLAGLAVAGYGANKLVNSSVISSVFSSKR